MQSELKVENTSSEECGGMKRKGEPLSHTDTARGAQFSELPYIYILPLIEARSPH